MSSMLEQAIVDAAKLREAALKNAEAAIIEKYAPEIKNAVESLLEQEMMDDEMAPPPMDAPEEVDVPPAYAEGEDMCPCPEDAESVELEMTFSLEDLQDMAKELEPPADEFEAHSDVADEVVPAEEEMLEEAHCGDHDETLEEEVPEYDPEEHGKASEGPGDLRVADMGTEDKEDDILVKESDDDIVLDEEAIAALVEELVVDISPQKSGWAGTPESQMKHYEEMELARLAGEEARAQQEELQKAVEDLKERNERLGESNKALKETVAKLKNAFDEMSTSNAKLLYTNRILSSPSLNERQKENIVEAISKAGSVNEAKVIYETLQSTGGTPSKKAMPKSLSEAIKRSSTTILPRRQPEQTADTAIDRLQILAGIKNK